jgi:predicted O-methyltransferase YrrM
MSGGAVRSDTEAEVQEAGGAGEIAPAAFRAALEATQDVEGWLSEGQARVLYDRAARLGAGSRVVEIGSHHGRSSIVLAKSARSSVEIVSIDPFARPERAPSEKLPDLEIGERDLRTFESNLERASVRERIRHVREPSGRALRHVRGPVDLLYVDGAHEFSAARGDLRDWGARVREGGTMLVHDSFSSIGVTLAQIVTLFFARDFRYVGRSRSLSEYRRERISGLSRLRNAAQQAAQLPWFGRNVVVKIAMSVGARPVARLLRHREDTFPY